MRADRDTGLRKSTGICQRFAKSTIPPNEVMLFLAVAINAYLYKAVIILHLIDKTVVQINTVCQNGNGGNISALVQILHHFIE